MALSCNFFVPYTALQTGFHPCERRTNCATKDNNKQINNVMMKKSFYEAPEAELLLVKFEENIMSNGLPTSTVTTVEDEWEDNNG